MVSQCEISDIPIGNIDNAIFHNLERLDEIKLPNKAIGFDPDVVLKFLSKGRDKQYDTRAKKWKGLPTQPIKSGDMADNFADALDRIGAVVSESMDREAPCRSWVAEFLPEYTGCQTTTLMDSKHAKQQEVRDHSVDYAVVDCDFKEGSDLESALNRLSQVALSMFSTQCDRTYVPCLALLGDHATFVMFSRAGLFLSDTFNIHRYPERFIRVVAGMMYASRDALGFDPSMHWTTFDGSNGRCVKVKRTTYNIVRILHFEKTIRGRATICLEVTHRGKTYALKNSWRDNTDLHKETEIMRCLEGVEGVSQLVKFELLTTRNGIKDTKRTIGLDKTKWLLDEKALHQARVVTESVGETLRNFRSLPEFLNALVCIVDAIENLHNKGIVHRDISAHNIILVDEENEHHERRAILIDFDRAELTKEADSSTGTWPYMAIDVLARSEDFQHAYYHDLESLFYLLCYVCCTGSGPNNSLNGKTSTLSEWCAPPAPRTLRVYRQASKRKKESVSDEAPFKSSILAQFDPYFAPLKECAMELRDLIFAECMYGRWWNIHMKVQGGAPDMPLPIDRRDPASYIGDYRRILKKAYDSLDGPKETNEAEEVADPQVIVSAKEDDGASKPDPLDPVANVDAEELPRAEGKDTGNSERVVVGAKREREGEDQDVEEEPVKRPRREAMADKGNL